MLESAGSGRYGHAMSLTPRHARLLVVCCLVLFQSQLIATAWLPCRHAAPAASDVICPLHAQQMTAPLAVHPHAALLFDCAKCRLAAVLGSLQSLQPLVTVSIQSGTPSRHPGGGCFYYQFFPDPAAKPPRDLLV